MIRDYVRGQKISEPGIYRGVPMQVYHGADLCDGPSISSSGLRKIINQSPAHYWVSSPYNPDRIEREETKALTFGRAAHHLLLGEDDFSTLFIVRPDKWDSWRTDASRAWRDEQEADGRTVLIPAELDTIRGIAKSLAVHPLVRAGILNGAIEQTMVWRCKETGIWKKARPDAMPNDSGDFADLKTTTSVRDDDLIRTLAEYQYHAQGALICEGWHALTGNSASSFSLVFAEKSPPHCVRIVTLRDEDLARGERQNYQAAAIFAQCMQSGEWPGPGKADAEYLPLPDWYQKRVDRQFEELQAAE